MFALSPVFASTSVTVKLSPQLISIRFTALITFFCYWFCRSRQFVLPWKTWRGFKNLKEGPDKARKRWDWIEGGRGLEGGRGREGGEAEYGP